MHRWWIFVSFVIAIVAIAAATFILLRRPVREQAYWVEGYSAQVNFTDLRDPSKSYRGFVYSNVLSQLRAFRMEMNFPDRKRIRIWRQDDGVSLVLDPDAKTFWTPKMKGSVHLVSGLETDIENGVKRLIGQEKIDGRLTDHWEVTNIDGVVEQYWVDSRLHVTLKSIKPRTSTYELTNIKEGHQRTELFTIPQDYRKIDQP